MQPLSEKIDKQLVDLAWSLWTELGVAGVKRQHQDCLIAPEELILLTAVIAEADPRLRDEALDWCIHNHHYISISRLRALIKIMGDSVSKAFSIFAATLNSVSGAHWPLFTPVSPLKFLPSGKSKLSKFELPALLCFRIRTLFGVGVRADLISFFLVQERDDFIASDATEIGYGKRSIADVLESFVQAGVLETFMVRNQRRYRFARRDLIISILGALPTSMPPWWDILEVVLTLRACIQRIEKKSDGTKITEIRNALMKIENKLRRINLIQPPMQSDLHAYWDSFANWILGIVESLALGEFRGKNQPIEKQIPWDEMRDASKRIEIQFKGLFSNIESLKTHSNNQTKQSLFENYKGAFRKNIDTYLPKLYTDDQKELRQLADELLLKAKSEFTGSLKTEILSHVDKILKKYSN